MVEPSLESKIFHHNLKHFGIDRSAFFRSFGDVCSDILVEEYGSTKSYTVITGLGGNGADGFATAIALVSKGITVSLYVLGRKSNVQDDVLLELIEEADQLEKISSHFCIDFDSTAKDIDNDDVIVEAIVGTGLIGKNLRQRAMAVVKRISHFKKPIVSLDVPAPHYTPSKVVSLGYPKTEDAEVIEIEYPNHLAKAIGPGDLEFIVKPKRSSYKSRNGAVLSLSDESEPKEVSKEILKEYESILSWFSRNSKKGLRNSKFFSVETEHELEQSISRSESILFGNFEPSFLNKSLIANTLETYPEKSFVFYGASLHMLDTRLVTYLDKALLILDRTEVHTLFESKKSVGVEGKLKRFCIENNCYAVLIGSTIQLFAQDGSVKSHQSAKIFEKDFKEKLAFQIATYATRNHMWLSMRAGVYVCTE